MELGAWLPGHIDDMLALPGFIEANRFDPVEDSNDRLIHTVQYVLSDQAALDQYLETQAETMRAKGLAIFGDDLDASRNVHAVVSRSERADANCLNCDVVLDGQYCWNCGQRGNTRLISLMELVRDAVGDMFELDSRMWRTLLPLLRRPGYLTAEYLRGRRARYMPPFRMYLVLSFLFFLLTRTMGDGDGTINFNADISGLSPEEVTQIRERLEERIGSDNLTEEQAETLNNLLTRLEAEVADPETGEIALSVSEIGEVIAMLDSLENADEATTEPDLEAGTDGGRTLAEAELAAAVKRENSDEDDDRFYCEIGLVDTGIPYIDERITPERVQAVCDDIKADSGRRFIDKIAQNTPVAALALLPLLAFLLKLLYPLSRRYYVEHLLLLVHYHSFAFLAVSLLYVYNVLLGMTSAAAWAFLVPNILIGIYIPLYLYKAMRRVYEQGRIISIFKYLLLLGGYIMAIVLVLATMLIYIVITY